MTPLRPDHKKLTYENPAYLDYIREHPCVVCGKKAVAHHESGIGTGLVGGGTSKKCSDLAAVPLCIICHSRRHDRGYVTFWCNFIGLTQCNPNARLIADGIVMREIIKLQMGWIEK